MIIDSVYDGYTNWLYKSNPGLENQPYAIQHSKTIHGGFHNATVWAKPLRKLGCEVTDVFHNQVPLQIRWCIENGYKNVLEKYSKESDSSSLTLSFENILEWQEIIVEQQVRSIRPDIIWIADLFSLGGRFLEKINGEYSFAIGEITSNIDGLNLENFDLILSGALPIVMQLRAQGKASELLLHGFREQILAELESANKKFDVSFVGQLTDKRPELLRQFSKYLNINVWANSPWDKAKTKTIGGIHWHQPVYGIDMYQTLRNSKIVINNHISAVQQYASNQRLYEVTGVGTMLLTDEASNLEEIFHIDKEVVSYSNPKECANIAKYYLENPKEREAIALAGKQRTLSSHTVEHRSHNIISILKNYFPEVF
tara:strand:+ start:649 stop:1758 length:1110 start_codon:yes stop_codon:yes gene_type:complete